jgi:hypothetical protein
MIRTAGMPDERRSGIVAPRWIDRFRLFTGQAPLRPIGVLSTPVLRPSQNAMGRLAWLC